MKFAGIATALTATLLLGGCNEEKKYNALKMEVVKIVEDGEKYINKTDVKTGYVQLDWRIGKKQATENLNLFLEQKKVIEQKLQEMEKLSKESVNLSNDYLRVKERTNLILSTNEASYKRTLERAIEEKRD